MLVADHDVGVAVTPLNVTVLVPCVDPKFVPVIVTDAPTAPLVGDSDVIVGGGVTVNVTPLLATPPTVTDDVPRRRAARHGRHDARLRPRRRRRRHAVELHRARALRRPEVRARDRHRRAHHAARRRQRGDRRRRHRP